MIDFIVFSFNIDFISLSILETFSNTYVKSLSNNCKNDCNKDNAYLRVVIVSSFKRFITPET